MTKRDKLIEILSVPIYPHLDADPTEVVADYLLDHGVEPVNGWIDVNQQLPNEGEAVLLYAPKRNQMFVGYHLNQDYSWNKPWFLVTAMGSKQSITQKVTHWMPLPESPREDE